ncbi:MAG: hypothetical protein A2939_04445 [Parcubacteria group bacterium RIFCSPLOWO2_01_FULL_48_18]|nr:MAG: hypothetical protein A3J67_03675 [Parcubacteria group bacterium RIFCSPHIGHO2_02_FULL_48_10b]OHB22629.1 MAG: hypothetical protein A2939_04445 [Parcubacteria group bacterium RIFCSPLOWO2_01_FULL_48_18]
MKDLIRKHYDLITPFYLKLWGEHIHHGLWLKGNETKEEAQENLIRELIRIGQVQKDAKILDVGCGLGGSSIYLANHLCAEVTGITISPVQAEMANKKAKSAEVKNATFLVMDAEDMKFSSETFFDVIWAVESISHFPRKEKFFKDATALLKPGGKFILADWFQGEEIGLEERERFIKPIEKGMLTPKIEAMSDYENLLKERGLQIITSQDISKNVQKTWEIASNYLRPFYWLRALINGKDIFNFLKAFRSMRRGFKSGNFRYGLIVGEK